MRWRFIALVALALNTGCKRTPSPTDGPKEALPSTSVTLSQEGFANARIRTQKLSPGTYVPRLRLSGTIAGDPRHVAQVGARVSGRVTAIRVALGDRVKRGQVLFEVDAVEFHQTVLELRTAMAKARSAHDTLSRQKQLVEERVGAVQDLRRAEAEASAADAALGEAKEHLKFMGLSDSDVANVQAGTSEASSRITSPIDGRVASLSVTLGQTLTGSETVAVIADVDSVWAQARVYERDLAEIRVGAAASIQVPTYRERSFDGKVEFISDVLDPSNRSADVRISLVNAEGALKPGMSAVVFVTRQSAPGLWLPVTATQSHDGVSIVFIRTGERTFDARPVTAGEEQGGFVPLLRGVGPNDDVVVEGAFALRGELERASLGGD